MLNFFCGCLLGIVGAFILSGVSGSITIGHAPEQEAPEDEDDFEPCAPDCLGCAIFEVTDAVERLEEIAEIRVAELEQSKSQIENAQLEGIQLEREQYVASDLSAKIRKVLAELRAANQE